MNKIKLLNYLNLLSNNYFTKKLINKYYSTQSLAIINEKTPEINDKIETYSSVIGLEVHAQILSKSKLFSSSSTSYISSVNSQVSLFDMALPGTLPVLNRRCVEAAIITGLALNCQIANKSTFDRKHYFYADMPAGYQITQLTQPIATNGYIDFVVHSIDKSYLKRCKLKQIQIEQDSGKSLQDEDNMRSLVDLNRAGVGLMEFVFEPDLCDPNEAVSLVKELVLILKRIKTCSCKMNEGALRVDANVSVHKPGQPFGVRTEVKNLNSYHFIKNAIKYEIERQISLVKQGKRVINETRMFDSKTDETIPMRDKEVVQDYRFMPEPNLPPIFIYHDENMMKKDQENQEFCFSPINLNDLKKSLPILPDKDREDLIKNHSLGLGECFLILNEPGMLKFFKKVIKVTNFKDKVHDVFKFINSEVKLILDDNNSNFEECLNDEDRIIDVIKLLFNNEISLGTAHDVLNLLFQDQRTPSEIVDDYGWKLIKDEQLLRSLCIESIEEHKKVARRYFKKKIKKPKSVLVGYVMKKVENRVNEDDVWTMIDKLVFYERILDNFKGQSLSEKKNEKIEEKQDEKDE